MAKLTFNNPSTINLYAEFSSTAPNGLILFNADDTSASGEGVEITYDGPSIPTTTTFTLKTKPDTSPTVSGVTTTDEGGNPVNKPWSDSSGPFTYSLKQSLIGTNHHTAGFTVAWSDGSKHDPKIVINPTN